VRKLAASSSPAGGTLNAYASRGLSAYQIEVIFALFDADGDGSLSKGEFLDVLEKRGSRGLAETRTFWVWDRVSDVAAWAKGVAQGTVPDLLGRR